MIKTVPVCEHKVHEQLGNEHDRTWTRTTRNLNTNNQEPELEQLRTWTRTTMNLDSNNYELGLELPRIRTSKTGTILELVRTVPELIHGEYLNVLFDIAKNKEIMNRIWSSRYIEMKISYKTQKKKSLRLRFTKCQFKRYIRNTHIFFLGLWQASNFYLPYISFNLKRIKTFLIVLHHPNPFQIYFSVITLIKCPRYCLWPGNKFKLIKAKSS